MKPLAGDSGLFHDPDREQPANGGDQETCGPDEAFLTLRSARRKMPRRDERRGMRASFLPRPWPPARCIRASGGDNGRRGLMQRHRNYDGLRDKRSERSARHLAGHASDGGARALAWLTSLRDRNLNAEEKGWPFRLGLQGCLVDCSQDIGWQRTFGHGRTQAGMSRAIAVKRVLISI
jgi:hypothetical protein